MRNGQIKRLDRVIRSNIIGIYVKKASGIGVIIHRADSHLPFLCYLPTSDDLLIPFS